MRETSPLRHGAKPFSSPQQRSCAKQEQREPEVGEVTSASPLPGRRVPALLPRFSQAVVTPPDLI